ncbi:MAG: hypothetical protein L6R19_16295 [Alphaproteobacteria bacterium]|nr:hypothetical protein [Alphaproteobacteria bacterium]
MGCNLEIPAVRDGHRAERRRFRRFTVVWDGLVVGGAMIRCVVLNISAEGSKLRLPAGAMLPSRFVLSLPGRGRFDAELVELAGPIARARLLDDRNAVAEAVADVVPTARFLHEQLLTTAPLH